MKNQRPEIRDQESKGLERLLRQAMPPIGTDQEIDHDLWPAMLRRLHAQPAATPAPIPWFDWMLAGALVVLIAAFPAAIPVLLYYL